MAMNDLKDAIPDYAKDIKLNLSALSREKTLTEQQLYGTMLACALAAGEPSVIRHTHEEARSQLDEAAIAAAKTAAAIMAMNNVYYRFVHLASAEDYKQMRAGLRMNAIGNPGIEREDFELFCLAVSAINACGACIDSHDATLRKAGMKPEALQAAVRIAAVVHAVARTMQGEAALSES